MEFFSIRRSIQGCLEFFRRTAAPAGKVEEKIDREVRMKIRRMRNPEKRMGRQVIEDA
jgi:hypothetical protein